MTSLRNQSLTSDNRYYSQNDQAVVERLKNLGANEGLGDAIFYQDEELAGVLQDFGYTLPEPDKE